MTLPQKTTLNVDLSHIDEDAPETFENLQQVYDWLGEKYGEVVTKLSQLTERKFAIRDKLDELAGTEEKKMGVVHLHGNKLKISLTRKLNSSYPKKDIDGKTPFLQTVYEEVPQLRDGISVKFVEKISKMNKLLEEIKNLPESIENDQLRDLAEAVEERRVINKGSTEVKVQVK